MLRSRDSSTKMCPDCIYEQAEAAMEATRWAEYLKTNPRLPQNPLPQKAFMHTVSSKPRSKPRPAPQIVPQDDGSEHACHYCGEGGRVLCCSYCPLVFHMDCLVPPLESVPDGMWACPSCEEQRPRKPPGMPTFPSKTSRKIEISKERRERKKRQRHASSGSGLFDTLPSDMSFERQMELALVQSQRDEERREKRAKVLEEAREQLGCRVTPQDQRNAGRRQANHAFLTESANFLAGGNVDEDTALTASKTGTNTEEVIDELVIEEAADITQLGGFTITAHA